MLALFRRPPVQPDLPPATLQLLRDLRDGLKSLAPLLRRTIQVSEDLTQTAAVLAADETALRTEIANVVHVIKTFPDKLAAAIASAKADGASPEQLKAFQDLHAGLQEDLGTLHAAVEEANAPPAAAAPDAPAPAPEEPAPPAE